MDKATEALFIFMLLLSPLILFLLIRGIILFVRQVTAILKIHKLYEELQISNELQNRQIKLLEQLVLSSGGTLPTETDKKPLEETVS